MGEGGSTHTSQGKRSGCALVLLVVAGVAGIGAVATRANKPQADVVRAAASASNAAELAEAERKAKEKAEADRAEEVRKREAHEAAVASYRALTPPKRLDALTKACPKTESKCDDTVIAQIMAAAADDAERTRMNNKATQLRQAAKDRADMEARVKFAEAYEEALFARKRNPDWVKAVGPEKRTLRVRGWFCAGRQFVHDFSESDDVERAATLGFQRMECVGAFNTASVDFKVRP